MLLTVISSLVIHLYIALGHSVELVGSCVCLFRYCFPRSRQKFHEKMFVFYILRGSKFPQENQDLIPIKDELNFYLPPRTTSYEDYPFTLN